jgi:prepilin-type N-terminal cleavage/methylation domain-containing protein
MNSQKGITLLEILVGVTIFAISLSIAAGVFSGTLKYQKKSEISRSIDQDVRTIIDQISSDIRNSNGIVAVDNSNIYYSFAGYNNRLYQTGTSPNHFDNQSKVLLVNISDDHRRQYYTDSSDRLFAQDIYYNRQNSSWQFDSNPQPISGEDIIVSNLKFNVFSASNARNIANNSLDDNRIHPYVKIFFNISYDNRLDKAELRNENLSIETVITSRNFSYLN